ncbi:MAG TPA: PepSY domain-containing protein [Amnibacterium sp.]|jgi:hypothetical protein|nr:PepSY domain-containing protein [Amnibacterium sp.]
MRKRGRVFMAGVLGMAVVGVLAGCAASASGVAASPSGAAPSSSSSVAGRPAGGGSNARSGPAAGGSSGTIDSVASSGFTLTTSAGQQVTVNETSSTVYRSGSSTATVGAVTVGKGVVVLGTVSGTTITAGQVTVGSAAGGSAASSAAGVVPFTRGAPSTAKKAGTIPTGYTEGSGTIVSGTTADSATEAALAAYPGGVVDRVVKLGNGDYEVHYIGVNWPHHIFVDPAFKVLGAD